MSSVGDVIAVVTLSFQLGKACKNYLSDLRHRDENVQRLNERLEALGQVAQSLNTTLNQFPDKVPAVLGNLKSLLKCRKDLEDLQKSLQTYQGQASRNSGFSALRRLKWPISKEQLTADVERLGTYIQEFALALSVDATNASFRIEHQVSDLDDLVKSVETKLTLREQHDILETLAPVLEAAFDSNFRQHEPQCLPQTRKSLLREIHNWSNDLNSEPIFWLCGMAGTGKSTIAQSLAQQFRDENRLAGSFFFSRSRNLDSLTRADKVFSTLAYQAASHITWFRSIICAVLQTDSDLINKRMQDQYQKLLLEPLRQCPSPAISQSPSVLIIDALDECQDQRDIEVLLNLVSKTHDLNTLGVKFILTSRPEQTTIVGFRSMRAWTIKLHDIEKDIVYEDIRRYLEDQFNVIGFRNGLENGWVASDIVDRLSRMSEALFIFPATICRFLDSMKSKRRMKQFVNGFAHTHRIEQSSLQQLDAMYSLILEGPASSTGYVEDFQTVLGSILVLHDALDPSALGLLLFQGEDEPEEAVFDVLLPLQSVVVCNRKSPITLLHTSFRDFLLDNKRCVDKSFRIDHKLAHTNLLRACLTMMRTSLRKNINESSDPVLQRNTSGPTWDKVSESIPAHLRYACRHWAEHFYNSSETGDCEEVVSFLQTCGLYWIEALAWLQELSRVAACMNVLRNFLLRKRRGRHLTASSIVDPQEDSMDQLSAWTYDVNRFILTYGSVAAIAPLQLYCSAISFAPTGSLIKQSFVCDAPDWVKPALNVDEDWDSYLTRFNRESQGDCVHALSPDLKTLVSVETLGSIQAWDTTTSLLLYRSAHRFLANTSCKLTFSPDGKSLLISTDTLMMLVFKLADGTLLGQRHFPGDRTSTAAFGQKENEVVLLSNNAVVIRWDYHSGDIFTHDILDAMGKKSSRVIGVSTCHQFLVAEKYLFTESTPEDSEMYKIPQTLPMSSGTGRITVYRVSDGEALRTVETGLERIVEAYVSVQDQTLVVVGSRNPYSDLFHFDIFRIDTGMRIDRLGAIQDMLVSPSSRAIYFTRGRKSWLYVPSDNNRKVSIATSKALRPSEVQFSADGAFLAVRSDLGVDIWDAATGTMINSLPTPVDSPPRFSISMSDFLTVLDVGNGHLDMWQTSVSQSSLRVGKLAGPNPLTFESGKTSEHPSVPRLRCQHDHEALTLMNATEGSVHCRLRLPTRHVVHYFRLSPDSRWLAICSDTILVLDRQDPEGNSYGPEERGRAVRERLLRKGEIQGRHQPPHPTGSRIMVVTVLDTLTLCTIKHFGFFWLEYSCIQFSTSNTLLVSGSTFVQTTPAAAMTIGLTSFLWDPQSPAAIGRIHLDPAAFGLNSLAFSPDGRRLVISFALEPEQFRPQHDYVQVVDTNFEHGHCRTVTAWPCEGSVRSVTNDQIVVSTDRTISTYEMSSGRQLRVIRRYDDNFAKDAIPVFLRQYILLEAIDRRTGLRQTQIRNIDIPHIAVELEGQYHLGHQDESNDSCLELFTSPKSIKIWGYSDGRTMVMNGVKALDFLLSMKFFKISPVLIDHTCTWISVNGKPVLWIPPSRRPGAGIANLQDLDVYGSTVWLTGETGTVTCLKLDLDSSYNV